MEGSILIADSDTDFRNSLVRFFTSRRFAVSAFEDGAVAMDSLLHDRHDIAIIEFCKPSLRDSLCASLAKRNSGTALVLMCGTYTRRLEIQARSLAPAFFFVKPFEINDLYAVVIRLIEAKDKQAMLSLQRAHHREGVSNG